MNASLEKFFEVSLSFLAVIAFFVNGLRTDRRTNGQTDKASCRDAWTHDKGQFSHHGQYQIGYKNSDSRLHYQLLKSVSRDVKLFFLKAYLSSFIRLGPSINLK